MAATPSELQIEQVGLPPAAFPPVWPPVPLAVTLTGNCPASPPCDPGVDSYPAGVTWGTNAGAGLTTGPSGIGAGAPPPTADGAKDAPSAKSLQTSTTCYHPKGCLVAL